ncbi:hypothetical protein YC2023_059864 [Brassica napus]|uniref:Uncharacterized protein n=1 Tax=Brassica oleracea TaxID=3712 RepID=A0A3P6EWX5_BRAOL|nr:unnamed protein product [Brassica oleracea]
MVITQLRFSDFKAGRCKDTVVTDLLRFWESRNVKNLAKFYVKTIKRYLAEKLVCILFSFIFHKLIYRKSQVSWSLDLT